MSAVTNFFDTLGIGSFAPSGFGFVGSCPTADPADKARGLHPAVDCPGADFLALLGAKIDPLLLVLWIAAMVVGGVVRVPIAARAPIQLVQGLVALAC